MSSFEGRRRVYPISSQGHGSKVWLYTRNWLGDLSGKKCVMAEAGTSYLKCPAGLEGWSGNMYDSCSRLLHGRNDWINCWKKERCEPSITRSPQPWDLKALRSSWQLKKNDGRWKKKEMKCSLERQRQNKMLVSIYPFSGGREGKVFLLSC